MYTLVDIRKYLATNRVSTFFVNKNFDQLKQLLLEWAAGLPSQTESQQVQSIEKILIELTTLDLEEEQLVALMNTVITSVEHLVASLQKHYIYEVIAFNDEQSRQANQVKYLYYLVIEFYDITLRRQVLSLTPSPLSKASKDWRQSFKSAKKPLLLAATLYQTLFFYQKLLHEQALSYQKPFQPLWSVINQLYVFAYEQGIEQTDISDKIAARKAKNIHELYLQICLYDLLNITLSPRPNLLLIQRLLPAWSQHLTVSTEFQTNTRIFVDLKSASPPEYLNANTSINPYDKNYFCLFIDLSPLAVYLEECKLALKEKNSYSMEYRLFERMLITINYRYLERENSIPTKRSAKLNAKIITKFNTIYEHIDQNASLREALEVKSISTATESSSPSLASESTMLTTMEVKTFDSTDVLSPLRILQISSKTNTPAAAIKKSPCSEHLSTKTTEPILFLKNLTLALVALHQEITEELTKYNALKTFLPLLQIDSLLLLSRPSISGKLRQSIGIVRWLTVGEVETEIEWQVLGHLLTACSLALDNSSAHNLSELPAIMVAGDDDLQTTTSLLVPAYHFSSHNRVVMRIGESKKSLHLKRCLLNTNVFSQYEFEYLNE